MKDPASLWPLRGNSWRQQTPRILLYASYGYDFHLLFQAFLLPEYFGYQFQAFAECVQNSEIEWRPVYDIHSFDALRSIPLLLYSVDGVQLQVLLVVERCA